MNVESGDFPIEKPADSSDVSPMPEHPFRDPDQTEWTSSIKAVNGEELETGRLVDSRTGRSFDPKDGRGKIDLPPAA